MITAKSIAVAHCDCGNVHIALFDAEGAEVARATLPPIEASEFVGEIATAIEAAVDVQLARRRPN
ncbi:hypothetical protein [Phenylobacterium sp.]|uniref:hypothetical protein n=1 Tax=Phenylobacterium sp. TaxID=1871053 RepID=UPI0035B30A8C